MCIRDRVICDDTAIFGDNSTVLGNSSISVGNSNFVSGGTSTAIGLFNNVHSSFPFGNTVVVGGLNNVGEDGDAVESVSVYGSINNVPGGSEYITIYGTDVDLLNLTDPVQLTAIGRDIRFRDGSNQATAVGQSLLLPTYNAPEGTISTRGTAVTDATNDGEIFDGDTAITFQSSGNNFTGDEYEVDSVIHATNTTADSVVNQNIRGVVTSRSADGATLVATFDTGDVDALDDAQAFTIRVLELEIVDVDFSPDTTITSLTVNSIVQTPANLSSREIPGGSSTFISGFTTGVDDGNAYTGFVVANGRRFLIASNNSVVVGDGVISTGENNIGIGLNTGVNGDDSIAIGNAAVAGNNAIAFGHNVNVTEDNRGQIGGATQEMYLGRATANDDGDLAVVTKDYADDASAVAEIQILGFPDTLTVYLDGTDHRLEWDTAQVTVQRGDTRLDYTTTDGDPSVDQYKVTSDFNTDRICLLYTSPSPRDRTRSRMPSSA